VPAGPFQDEHVGTGPCRLEGGRRTGAAEADDEHVALEVRGAGVLDGHGPD
jgi:hypothetical protein